MAVTEPIFINVALAWQHFLKNSYTEFHKNRTRGSVADTGPDTDGRKDRQNERRWSPRQAFSRRKKRLNHIIFYRFIQVFNFVF
jgi:hypothetical protein